MEKRKVKAKKNDEKISEYPIIYSYIYERETEDIKRLSAKFKNARARKASVNITPNIIIGYQMVEGKVVPIFEKKEFPKTKSTKKSVPKKSTPSNKIGYSSKKV